ncbi:peptidoglycan-binding domain-containing protein [Roseobacter sp. HKCCD5988]|uniref:peptidoglycan-binding domain-containing protein n=1 Tax=Roseobacter sp. HKCCD5988 TaxID=3120338 RepID=UPI0030EBE529
MKNLLINLFTLLALLYPLQSKADGVAQLQQALADLGYRPGPVDGQYGRQTADALEQFLQRANLQFDGNPTSDLIEFTIDFRNYSVRPTELLASLVTQSVHPFSLSDDQVCETLRVLPLRETFEVAQSRGLNCDLRIKLNLDLPKAYDGILELREYSRANSVVIPSINLDTIEPIYSNIAAPRQYFNEQYRNFSQTVESATNAADVNFCRHWLPELQAIMPDPSKNLDGSGSWLEGSLVDAQVICADALPLLYLSALSNSSQAEQSLLYSKRLVETWVETDAPQNLYFDTRGANTNFMYILIINQVTAGVELLHSGFNWEPEQYESYKNWAIKRVLQIFPFELHNPTAERFCSRPTSGDMFSDECQNAAALAAQAMLRVGILTQSAELVENAYLIFHRYMSAIRPDGSPAFDSMRGCYAADYVAWAAMFSDGFLFQWSRISEIDWSLSVNNGGTVEDMFSYALSVVQNPNLVNNYAGTKRFDECYDASGNLQQVRSPNPQNSFATYLFYNEPQQFAALHGQWLSRNQLTRSGGPLYDNVLQNSGATILRENQTAHPIDQNDEWNGRYVITWSLFNEFLNDYETTARDILELENGRGEIQAGWLVDASMGPSEAFRANMAVSYDLEGNLSLEGFLDYWCCDSPEEYVQIIGNISEGELFDGVTSGSRRYQVSLAEAR